MSPELSRRGLLATAGALGAAVAVGTSGPAAASSAAVSDSPARRRRSAALVVHNARVLTGDSRTPVRQAIAVGRDGTILETGSSAELRRYIGRDTDVLDARGGTVMSGIHDGHAHPLGAGERSLHPSLEDAALTVPQLQEILGGFLRDSAPAEPDGWLIVESWNPVGLLPTGTVPHHRYLDALPTRRPVVLIGDDGHNLWANQRALDLAGITAATPDPVGGKIVRDPDGKPTGLLKDDAQPLVTRVIPDPTPAELHEAYIRVLNRAAASGITTFLDASVGEGELEGYAALAAAGRLPQRIHPALRVGADLAKDPKAALQYVRGLRSKYGHVPGLTFGTVKVFLDGVIEYPAQTAALLTPYLDGNGRPTDNYGDLYVSAADYGRLTSTLAAAGWQMHAHAIGDRAVRTALDGYQTALHANGRRGNRHTIAHLQLVHPDDFRRFAPLGVIPCMQLQWALRDIWTMEALLPYIGPKRHRLMYPARSLQRHGAVLSGGSDWPVDPLQVWNQLRTAIDRIGGSSDAEGALYPELEGISRASSLAMHTQGSAYQLHQERLTGTLGRGMAADLVVLDRDVTKVPVAEISDTQVLRTLVGGRTVHDASTATGKAAAAFQRTAATSAEKRPATLAGVHGGRHGACGCADGGR
ncbi:amidohydrolase [Streptomyces sp. H10-C2]|uniref:amidohydrolase n=1 Tax=unclassified Streptomyces TaxID=2593676 RepID=UPI0024BA772E|nr:MULTISPECIES: amidohydrolase [unclassified Streptomyces]MDJ0344735.1 amidohydrolase [Streptomyces sp. PH10-H1]MDJ0371226.1 amidohydrolase [Streptomyces sp. H10-C2]